MAELNAVRGLEPGNGSPRTSCGLTSWGIHVAGQRAASFAPAILLTTSLQLVSSFTVPTKELG